MVLLHRLNTKLAQHQEGRRQRYCEEEKEGKEPRGKALEMAVSWWEDAIDAAL